jgi:hypothetical protein
MAKPMSPKGLAIREVIAKHPDWGNKEVAQHLSDNSEHEVKPADVAAQRVALKKAGELSFDDQPAQQQTPAQTPSSPPPGGQQAPPPAASPPAASGVVKRTIGRPLTLERLVAIKGEIDRAGGMAKVSDALAVLDTFQETSLEEIRQAVDGLKALMG